MPVRIRKGSLLLGKVPFSYLSAYFFFFVMDRIFHCPFSRVS